MIGKWKRDMTRKSNTAARRGLENALDRAEKNRQILSALCIDYTAAYCCDLLHDTMEPVKRKSFSHSAQNRDKTTDPNSYSEWIRYSYDHLVVQESSPDYLEVLDAENLMRRLQTEESVVYPHKTLPNAMGMEWFEANVVRLYVDENTFQVIIGYRPIDDLMAAERKQQEALESAMLEAKKANMAKSKFLANMSHDIRTPMNAIVGITNLMARETGLSQQMRTYIEKLQSSSQHLLSLINDVLDMGKIESNEVRLSQEPVSLAEQLKQVNNIIRPQASERGQSFQIRIHTITHEYVIGDGMRLRQVLLNLLSNAVKYTPYGGTIRFDLAEHPCDTPGHARFEITVEDTGYGMSPEFVAQVFEPFAREEDSPAGRVEGTGLGLSITKHLVDLMGGEIQVSSIPRRGSQFRVSLTLPIDPDAKYAAEMEGVLLISKDDEMTSNIEAAMQAVDLPFYAATSWLEAAAVLETEPVDVILIAGRLGDKTLIGLVQALRKAAKRDVLIFCCDYVQQEQVYEMLSYNDVNGLIPRPFFLSDLCRTARLVRSGAAANGTNSASILNGMRFLCAEDHQQNAEILAATLESNGAACIMCPDGEQLLKAFAEAKPGDYDAILMDVQLPKISGLEASRAIQSEENPLGQTIPIIAITANAFTGDIQQCLDAGMDAHVLKPLETSALERAVRCVVGKEFFNVD